MAGMVRTAGGLRADCRWTAGGLRVDCRRTAGGLQVLYHIKPIKDYTPIHECFAYFFPIYLCMVRNGPFRPISHVIRRTPGAKIIENHELIINGRPEGAR